MSKRYRSRKRYPKDIGLRFCVTCIQETYFRWSPSRNTFVCEICDYDESMKGKRLFVSEKEFLRLLDAGEIP